MSHPVCALKSFYKVAELSDIELVLKTNIVLAHRRAFELSLARQKPDFEPRPRDVLPRRSPHDGQHPSNNLSLFVQRTRILTIAVLCSNALTGIPQRRPKKRKN